MLKKYSSFENRLFEIPISNEIKVIVKRNDKECILLFKDQDIKVVDVMNRIVEEKLFDDIKTLSDIAYLLSCNKKLPLNKKWKKLKVNSNIVDVVRFDSSVSSYDDENNCLFKIFNCFK